MSEIKENIKSTAKNVGLPMKKIYDMFFILLNGEMDNNLLLQSIGVSKNVINQVKKELSSYFSPTSSKTSIKESEIANFKSIFDKNYILEEQFYSIFNSDLYTDVKNFLEKCCSSRPNSDRSLDQFHATIETVAKRACLMNFFNDIEGKKILFLGDDDDVSLAIAKIHPSTEITVLDVDDRILSRFEKESKANNFSIKTIHYDALKPLPSDLINSFDIVFSDPPYAQNGMNLFISRMTEALDLSKEDARIYLCYGNSDRAKERFIQIHQILLSTGFMIRWIFDKFNRYEGAESIGSSSSLIICDITPLTKHIPYKNNDKNIYTNT